MVRRFFGSSGCVWLLVYRLVGLHLAWAEMEVLWCLLRLLNGCVPRLRGRVWALSESERHLFFKPPRGGGNNCLSVRFSPLVIVVGRWFKAVVKLRLGPSATAVGGCQFGLDFRNPPYCF